MGAAHGVQSGQGIVFPEFPENRLPDLNLG
jgi:hypothetical protein